MAAYSFLKEANLYLVTGNSRYSIDISNISFSQTFTEESYSLNTLHQTKYFAGAIINKANPANFSFTFPVLKEADLEIIVDKILDCSTFDLYISTQQDTFKLETCVITNGTFLIERLKPLSITVQGDASKLSRAGSGSYTMPGTAVSRSSTRTYLRNSDTYLYLDSTDVSSDLVSVSIELQNDIQWNQYTTIQGALTATNASTSQYPNSFIIDKKILAGSFTRYLTDTNSGNLLDWSNDSTLLIKAGQIISSTFYGLQFNITNCTYSNRLTSSNVFTQNYDWRMTQNPSSLSSIITYTNV